MADRKLCPHCHQLMRDDRKGLTRWMANALLVLLDYNKTHPNTAFHAATLLRGTEGDRDHLAAFLRYWGFLIPVLRSDCPNALPEQRGSRGLSGFYRLTQKAKDFVEGRITVPKNIAKPFGGEWSLEGPEISFQEALRAELVTNKKNEVLNGTTR